MSTDYILLQQAVTEISLMQLAAERHDYTLSELLKAHSHWVEL